MPLCHGIEHSVHSKYFMYHNIELCENSVLKNFQGEYNNQRSKNDSDSQVMCDLYLINS